MSVKFYTDNSLGSNLLMLIKTEEEMNELYNGSEVIKLTNAELSKLKEVPVNPNLEEDYIESHKALLEKLDLETKLREQSVIYVEKKVVLNKYNPLRPEFYKANLPLNPQELVELGYTFEVEPEILNSSQRVVLYKVKIKKENKTEYSTLLGFDEQLIVKTQKQRHTKLVQNSFNELAGKKAIKLPHAIKPKPNLNVGTAKIVKKDTDENVLIEILPITYELMFGLKLNENLDVTINELNEIFDLLKEQLK